MATVFFPVACSYINLLFPTSIYLYQMPQQAQCFCEGNALSSSVHHYSSSEHCSYEHYCSSSVHYSFSAVQRYDFRIFTVVYLPLHGFILIQHNDQLPACQLSWWSTAPVSQRSWVQIPYRPEFFSGSISITVQEVFTTAKIAFIFTSLSVLQICALTLVIIAYWCLACIKNLQVVAFQLC